MMRKLTIGSCFSGIGGIENGLELTGGFETKWQCEINDYARRVLAKHWPGIPIYKDIKELYETDFPESVDVICGGFPCQPFSSAGNRKGEADERHLWPEFIRVIRQAKPRWVICENVPGLLTIDSGRPFGRILTDLATCGYVVEWDTISAASIGALHPRNRIFIIGHSMAYAKHDGFLTPEIKECAGSRKTTPPWKIEAEQSEGLREQFTVLEDSRCRSRGNGIGGSVRGNGRGELGTTIGTEEAIKITGPSTQSETVSLAQGEGGEHGRYREQEFNSQCGERVLGWNDTGIAEFRERIRWWKIESELRGVPNGLSAELDKDRMNRLKCLGNSVVPQIAQYLGERILEHELLNNQ
jgi:DNA-cytosine methyltransferase